MNKIGGFVSVIPTMYKSFMAIKISQFRRDLDMMWRCDSGCFIRGRHFCAFQ